MRLLILEVLMLVPVDIRLYLLAGYTVHPEGYTSSITKLHHLMDFNLCYLDHTFRDIYAEKA